ncbi:MAG: ComEA family DNA-binding protein [Lachnospiraceae bacterium]|nr:ComEA family DNA-binding protein [Lachnospiraceae bacterium]
MKINYKLLFLSVVFVVCGAAYSCSDIGDEPDIQVSLREAVVSESAVESDAVEESSDAIYVYICGEIVKSGVYEMKSGSRLFELVEAAGGLTADAAEDGLNLAGVLTDGQKIVVPSVEDMQTAALEDAYEDLRININTADIKTLVSLPGIGEARARDIIAYRNENGAFERTEDIKKVSGIKDSIYNKIKDLITAG